VYDLSEVADIWSDPLAIRLALLSTNYWVATAAHLDVSCRPTRVMLTNPNTDRPEFRRMIKRDATWFFKLLLLSRN
jgi:hypothetical protein